MWSLASGSAARAARSAVAMYPVPSVVYQRLVRYVPSSLNGSLTTSQAYTWPLWCPATFAMWFCRTAVSWSAVQVPPVSQPGSWLCQSSA